MHGDNRGSLKQLIQGRELVTLLKVGHRWLQLEDLTSSFLLSASPRPSAATGADGGNPDIGDAVKVILSQRLKTICQKADATLVSILNAKTSQATLVSPREDSPPPPRVVIETSEEKVVAKLIARN